MVLLARRVYGSFRLFRTRRNVGQRLPRASKPGIGTWGLGPAFQFNEQAAKLVAGCTLLEVAAVLTPEQFVGAAGEFVRPALKNLGRSIFSRSGVS